MSHSAVLLAGGTSSRMGVDKAWLEIEGEPLWRRQLATLRQLFPERLMLSGRSFGDPDCETIFDETAGAGPLGGVTAALCKCTTSHLVILAIDLPCMTAGFLRGLLADCTGEKGIVPHQSGRFEPLAAVYPVGCAELAAIRLRRGEHSLQHFIRDAVTQGHLRPRTVAFNDADLFFNLNTPADYEKFRKREANPSR
jgi:molybdopterin-guanine dinucleotide biosynthesis protein A